MLSQCPPKAEAPKPKRENRRFSSTQVLNHNSTKNQKTAPEFKQNPKTKRLFPKKNKKKEEKSLSIFQI